MALLVHETGEYFQLARHIRFDIPVVSELLKDHMKPGVLLQLLQRPDLSLPLESAGTVLSGEDVEPKKSSTVIFTKRLCKLREVDKLSMFS